jgi:hypothetical protein
MGLMFAEAFYREQKDPVAAPARARERPAKRFSFERMTKSEIEGGRSRIARGGGVGAHPTKPHNGSTARKPGVDALVVRQLFLRALGPWSGTRRLRRADRTYVEHGYLQPGRHEGNLARCRRWGALGVQEARNATVVRKQTMVISMAPQALHPRRPGARRLVFRPV